jgi:hypothetical protein
MAVHGRGDKHDESARRTANLETASTQRRYDEPADDGCEKSLVRCDARRNGNRHRERQGNDRDRQPGNHIRLKFRAAITFTQDRDQLGGEKFGKVRRCLMMLRSIG